jgi:outer membrane protein TolC
MKSFKIQIGSLLVFLSCQLAAQKNLDRYVQEGLASNETIKQQQFILEKSLYSLKEAKALFLPSVSFNTNYTLAGGGRTIDFPLGDLLNPAYSTLNQLTNTNNFPSLENQTILLNPNNFYDAKFRATLLILNLEIEYNRRIKKQQVALQQIEVDLFKRELLKEIKTAYFKYLQSAEAVKIYKSSMKLVEENLRINNSLFKNNKINRTALIRSENEITKYNSFIEVAEQNSKTAQAYFNFLLNKKSNEEILIDSVFNLPQAELVQGTSISQREELKKLRSASEINQQLVGLSKSYAIPKLNTFLDLGSQGFDWKFNDKTRYYFFGVGLQWDLFAGGKNRYKVKQAQLDSKIIQSQALYAEEQLQLQLETSINSFNASLSQYQAAIAQQTSSEKYYRDILKLYKEGQALLIELLDAQNQLLTSSLQANISLFDAWTKAAEIERANASFTLK